MKMIKNNVLFFATMILCAGFVIAEELEQKTEPVTEQNVLPAQDTTVLNAEQNVTNEQIHIVTDGPELKKGELPEQTILPTQENVINETPSIEKLSEQNGLNTQEMPIFEQPRKAVGIFSRDEDEKVDWKKKYDDVVNENMIYYYREREFSNRIDEYFNRSEADKEASLQAYEIDNRREINERFAEINTKIAKIRAETPVTCILEKLSSSWSTWYGKLFWFTGGFAAICGICNEIIRKNSANKRQQKKQEVTVETQEIVVFEVAR